MKMTEVREKAKALGLKTARMTKVDLIRKIQTEEGNFPCFQTARDFCDQFVCCWRDDCFRKQSPNSAIKEFVSRML